MDQTQVAQIIQRLAAGEQIPGWSYHPEQTNLYGDSQYAQTEPTSAFYNGQGYWADGNPMRNQTLDLGDVAKLAAIMGTAYLGGTALAGSGSAAGAAATAAPVTDAATAAFLEANMGALAPTVSNGFASTASLLAPEVAASTLVPEVAGSGLLAPEAAQVINITAPKAVAATTPSIAPGLAAGAVLAAPSLLNTPQASYSNEGRTPSEPRGNMGGEGTPEVPTVDVDPSPWDKFKAWATANPEMARLAFSAAGGLLSASGGSSGGSGGYKDSGYRPTITRGNWQPSVTPRSMAMTPTLINLPTTGNAGSGLWRYGLLGG